MNHVQSEYGDCELATGMKYQIYHFYFVSFGLFLINGSNACRKIKELRLIHTLGTLTDPHGIK